MQGPLVGTQEVRSAAIWVTKDLIPTSDNNNRYAFLHLFMTCIRFMFHPSEDGAERKIVDLTNFTLVHPKGTNCRSTELAPGAMTAMVRAIPLKNGAFI